MKSIRILAPLAALLMAAPAWAQSSSSQQVYPAELALPFGQTAGKIVISGEYLIFVDDTNVGNSFVMPRGNVESVTSNNGMTTVTFKQPMHDQSGERTRAIFKFSGPADAESITRFAQAGVSPAGAGSAAASSSDAQPNYQVKHDHKLGSCTGRLLVTPDKLIFESMTEVNDSRQWYLRDIKEVALKNPYKLEVKPFTGNDYTFELIGKGMDSADYSALTKRIAATRANR